MQSKISPQWAYSEGQSGTIDWAGPLQPVCAVHARGVGTL